MERCRASVLFPDLWACHLFPVAVLVISAPPQHCCGSSEEEGVDGQEAVLSVCARVFAAAHGGPGCRQGDWLVGLVINSAYFLMIGFATQAF